MVDYGYGRQCMFFYRQGRISSSGDVGATNVIMLHAVRFTVRWSLFAGKFGLPRGLCLGLLG